MTIPLARRHTALMLLGAGLALRTGLSPARAASDTPRRIVSTSPSITGILLAIDAPVVASAATTPSLITDAKGFFSQWAAEADHRGVAVLYPNVAFDIEAVVGAKPDLVVVSATGRDSAAPHQAELEALGIRSVVVDYSSRSWQELAVELGRATGLEAQAQAAIRRFNEDMAEAARAIDPRGAKVSVVGYDIAGSYSVARHTSPVAQLLDALGFTVVSVPPSLKPNSTRASDFVFFSRENLSAAITGDNVFLLRATARDVEAFLAEPVLANHPAIVHRRVYPLGPTSFRIDPYSGRQVADALRAAFSKP